MTQTPEAKKSSLNEWPNWTPPLADMNRRGVGLSQQTAELFNAAIAASAIAACFELGLFEELKKNDIVRIEDFCRRHDLHQPSILALLFALNCFDIVKLSPAKDVVTPGPAFAAAYGDKGYFLWLVRGYGNLWQNLPDLVKNGKGTMDSIGRNGKYIAMAGRDYGANFVDAYFNDMLQQMPFKAAADIGCGSAERLINLAKTRPDFRGVGVDLNPDAVTLAQQRVAAANLQDRLTVIHGDVRELVARPELAEVELLFCFFMAHDLWPRENCLEILQRLRAVFPNVKRFLLSDTYRADAPPSRDVPIFTLGFEVSHAAMGQYIPSIAEWMDLFNEAGWTCVERRDLGIPFSAIFDLR